MAFWSGEKLSEQFANLIEPPDAAIVDCSSVTLTVGAEVYISPVRRKSAGPSIRQLSTGEAFLIPPGQFAFLISEERVRVPNDAMALISMKAQKKWRGLINVSGFHVDPGYNGRLIFAVLNAGPAAVHLRRGEPCFLIWFADLDRPSEFTKNEPGFDRIPVDLVSNIASDFKTVSGVASSVDALKLELRVTQGSVAVVLALMALVAGHALWPAYQSSNQLIAPSTAPSTVASLAPTTSAPTRRR